MPHGRSPSYLPSGKIRWRFHLAAAEMSKGVVVMGVLLLSFLVWLWRYSPEDEVADWLKNNGLGQLRNHPGMKGVKTMEGLLELPLDVLKGDLREETHEALTKAVARLDLELWLQGQGLGTVYPILLREGYASREQLHTMKWEKALEVSKEVVSSSERQKFLSVIKVLASGRGEEEGEETSGGGWTLGGVVWFLFKAVLVLALVVGVLLIVIYVVAVTFLEVMAEAIGAAIGQVVVVIITGIIGGIISGITGRRVNLPTPGVGRGSRKPSVSQGQEFRLGLVERIRGKYLDVRKCRVEWNHDDNAEVGGSSVATVHLVCKNTSPYELQRSDNFQCVVMHYSTRSVVPHVVEPSPPTGQSSLKISFTTRVSGRYSIDLRVNSSRITGDSISRSYFPGPVDPSKTVFVEQSQVMVVTKGIYHTMTIVPKDSFNNPAIISQEHLTVEIKKDGPEGNPVNPECVVDRLTSTHYELLLKVEQEGHYVGCVLYHRQRIGPSSFTIICLNRPDADRVEKNLTKKNLNVWYEAHTVGEKGKMKRVYCYITPRQLQVKQFFVGLIPYRLFTCKVCPSTRLIFHVEQEQFTLDDGYQPPFCLSSPHREVLGATFYKFVLKNIGGSEKFQDKQLFFFNELKRHYVRQSRSEIRVPVSRFNLLDSAMQTTRSFSTSDWCKKFVVNFREEEALDWGGVSREFFQLLCVECFDATNHLFKRFKDSPQALVHPSHTRPPHLKLKHFEFAGRLVGKCLYESAMGSPLLVKARFTRSFLAQIIGLRINYRYFESDDPDLYVSKVQYIKENDVTDLELVFAEEEFDSDGGNPRVVPLMDHGEETEVVEGNKMQYLDLLAQHRLAKSCKEEIEHFLKGLNDIIPDHLLSIFDENELELLMCGLDTVSFEDLKQHTVVSGHSHNFTLVVSWFWTIVSSFTQEEMARLLQFVTGSSQLPPGGFKELSPKFQITAAPTHGRLPTAHTCFNQLCLPEYDTCEHFQQALMMAINEGSEGFGFL